MSLFSKSNSNRRIKRGREKRVQNLLEVTARPDRESRIQTWRKITAGFRILLLVGLITGAAVGGRKLVNRFIWENPYYALSDIRVSTDGVLTRAQILELINIREGQNIFTVKVSDARKELDLLPQVERADVRRFFPDRLEVRIFERQPVAWVSPSPDAPLGIGSGSYLVDTRGYVMRSRKIMPEHLTLPRIVGVVMEDVAPGQKLPCVEALSALDLIKLSSEDLRWQPRVVDISKGYCLVVTDDRKTKVTFGFENIDGQLSRLRQLIDYVEPQQKDLQSVNLMLERNIPVVFVPAPPPPPTQVIDPKTGKPKPGTTAKTGTVAQNGVSGGIPSGSTSAGSASGSFVAPTPKPASVVPKRSGASTARASSAAPDSNRAVKVAKLNSAEGTASANPDAAVQKTRRGSSQEDDAPPRSTQTSDLGASKPSPKPAVQPERNKPVSPSSPANTDTPPRVQPVTVPASESLRKLFNPHG